MTSTAARCNSARTLYLGGATVKQVACSDAALVITVPNSSVRRYPVARLSRIVCSAQVNWQGAALALCMRSGIPIVWADAHSQLLGICYSQHQRQQAFSQALELLLEGENGLSQYTHWLRSRRMDMLMDWARTTALDVTPARWESLKRSWVYHNELAVHLSLQIRTYCQAWVAQRLIHHQINPVYWGVQAECVDIESDMTHLVWAQINLYGGNWADQVDAEAQSIYIFEQWSQAHAEIVDLHLLSLQRIANKAA